MNANQNKMESPATELGPNWRIEGKLRWARMMGMLRGIHQEIAPKLEQKRKLLADTLDKIPNLA